MDWPILNTSYKKDKENLAFCVSFLLLAIVFQGSFTLYYVAALHSHLWLCNKHFTVCIHHSLFIKSFINGHLTCFYNLTIMNMLTWTFVNKFCDKCFCFSWLITWEWNCRVVMIICLNFWETAKVFSTTAVQFSMPASSTQGSQFLHIPTNSNCFRCFWKIPVDMMWYLTVVLVSFLY